MSALKREARRGQPYRLEILTAPASLPEARREELIDAFVELSAESTGGADWRSYRPAVEGWREYYSTAGARPQDYDRLVLIHDGDLLVHFTGVLGITVEPAERLIFIRSAMTRKAYHGAGLLKNAIQAVFSPAWLRELAAADDPVFFAIRTANPIVYEATRGLVSEYGASFGPTSGEAAGLELTLFPEIGEAGLSPMPEEIRDLAARTVAATSPGCQFLPETFVNKGYFKKYGALYRETAFPCRNEVTERYFNRVVDYANQDGILILIRMRQKKANGNDHG